MSEPYHIKYRPKTLEEIRGQDSMVDSIKSMFKNKITSRVFLFEGSSGCGKTTAARILARMLNVDDKSIIEMDVATKGGVDDSRTLIENLRYSGFGDNPNKFIILDEVHAASKAYWQSLLKTLEDTPDHVYFALCTTESGKVPQTIRTRCTTYSVKALRNDTLYELLEEVAEKEGLENLTEEMLYEIAKESQGSARGALVNLAKCSGCTTLKSVKKTLESVEGEEDIIVLCKMIADRNKPKLEDVVAKVALMREKSAESLRIVLINYLLACALGSKKPGEMARFIETMSFFDKPYFASEKMAPFLINVLEYLHSE